jgi:hypothetical protein
VIIDASVHQRSLLRATRFNTVEPSFSTGLADAGVTLATEWRELARPARLADAVALCELLTRRDVPHPVVTDVCDLVRTTIATRELP